MTVPPADQGVPGSSEPAGPSLLDEALRNAVHPDWEARKALLVAELDRESDRARAALLAYEAGELAERRLRDAGFAVASYGKALQSDPSLRPNLWAIRRVFYSRSLWPNLIKLIDAEVRYARNDDERADLFFEKGLILEDKSNDLEGAKAAYAHANELSPSYLPALLARERIALVARDDDTLRALWTTLAEMSISPSRRVAYLLDLARLDSTAGDEGSILRALAHVTDAAQIGAEREQVGRQYERLAYLTKDPTQVLAALEFRIGVLQKALDDPSVEVAGAETPLVDPEFDMPEIEITAGEPDDEVEIIAAYEDEGGSDDAAFQQELAAAEENEITGVIGETPDRVSGVADEEAEVTGVIGETPDSAQDAIGGVADEEAEVTRVIGETPDSAQDAITGVADDELAKDAPDKAGTRGAHAGRSGREIVALRRRQSRVSRENKDYDGAWQYLQSALEVAPSEPLLAADMADLAEITERWDELAELCARLGALNPDSAAGLTLSLRRADALTRSGRTEEAEAALDTIIANAPGYLPVIAQRERQTLSQGDWERLVGLHLAEAEAALEGRAFGPSEDPKPALAWAADAYVAAGDLFMMRLGREPDARLAYEQALAASPNHGPANLALCTLLDRAGRVQEAAELLERQVDAMGELKDDPRAPEALEMLARLFEEAGRYDDALRVVKRLATITPDDAATRAWIADLCVPCGALAERAELLMNMADAVKEPKRKSAAYLEAGHVFQHDLGQASDAVAAYKKAIEASPQDQYARAQLAALLWQSGQWEAIVELRRADAAHASPTDAITALREAASVLQRLGRPQEAAALYRELGDKADGDPHALRGLAEALRDDAGELAKALEKEVKLCAAGVGRAQALLRLAECYARQDRHAEADQAFKDADQAGDVGLHALWGRIAMAGRREENALLGDLLAELATREPGLSPDVLEDAAWLGSADPALAARRLDELFEAAPDRRSVPLGRGLLAAKQKDSRALAGAAAAQAEQAESPNMAASLFVRSATLMSVGDGPEHRALAFRALSMAADDPDVLVEAAEHVSDAGVDYLAKRSDLCEDDDAWADLEVQRGRRLRKVGRLAEAGRVVGTVLERVPGDLGALWLLRGLGKDGGDYETFVRATYQLAAHMNDDKTAAALLKEVATTLEELLARESDAAAVWRELLERVPLDDHAYQRAHALFSKESDVVALHGLLSHRIAHDTDPRAQVALRIERGRLRHKQNWQTGAAEDLLHVLEGQGDHLEALSALADVRLSQGNPHESAELLRRYLAASPERGQARNAEKRLAVVLADSIGDLSGAQSALEDVLRDDPNDVVARERLANVLLAQRDFVGAAEEFQHVTRLREDRIDRAQDHRSLANVCRRHLSDPDRARRALAEARKLDPLNPEIVRELSELTEGDERAQVFASALAELQQAIAETPTQSTHYACLAGSAHLAQRPALELNALGALIVLEAASAGDRERHDELVAELDLAKTPQGALTDEHWSQWLVHPKALDSYSEIWRCIAEGVAHESMPDLAALGYSKKDQLSQRAAVKQLPAVAAIGNALGVRSYDLYVTDSPVGADESGHYARVFSPSTPAIHLSSSVARADTVAARFLLGRAFAEARLRSSALEELLTDELRTYFALALAVGEADPKSVPELADVSDLGQRPATFAKLLGRKDRKTLKALVTPGPNWQQLLAWRDAVRTTTRRAGLLFAGELPTALALASTARGGAEIAADDAVLSLLIWGTSEPHMRLRAELVI